MATATTRAPRAVLGRAVCGHLYSDAGTVFSLSMHAHLKLHALQAEPAGMQTVQRALSSSTSLPHRSYAPATAYGVAPGAGVTLRCHSGSGLGSLSCYQPPSLMINGYASALPAPVGNG